MDLYSKGLNLNERNYHTNENEIHLASGQFEISTDSRIEGQATDEAKRNSQITTDKGNTELNSKSREAKSQAISEQSNTESIKEEEPIASTSQCRKTQVRRSLLKEGISNLIKGNPSSSKGYQAKRTKAEVLDVQPRRESSRKRKCTTVMDYGNEIKCHGWTNEQKEQLLKGLQKFGMDNPKEIKSYYLPHKSVSSIYNQIRTWRDLGQNDLQKEDMKKKLQETSSATLNLNAWIEHFRILSQKTPNNLFAISNVFLLIAEYGKFPEPSDCGGIDFRAMYRYLHCMLNGKPHYGMNQITNDVLNQCITNFLRSPAHKSKPYKILREALHEPSCKQTKTYSRIQNRKMFPSTLLKKPEVFLSLPDINPMNLPPEVFFKGQDEDEDSDSDSEPEFNDEFMFCDLQNDEDSSSDSDD